MKKFLKIFSINITLLFILITAPSIFIQIYSSIKIRLTRNDSSNDVRQNYPTYKDKEFASQIFKEERNWATEYRSFIGWRRDKVNLKYTEITGPYHKRKSNGEEIKNSVWFFGGSTMWGTGASNDKTIPSHFNSKTNLPVYNFGETGWNARQSLNQLINALGDGHKPNIVIFYDGVNDVIHQCRSEIKEIPAHSYENKLRKSLKSSNFDLFKPYRKIALRLKNKFVSNNQENRFYNCDLDKSKSIAIAKHLIQSWYVAYQISQSTNTQFLGILQPTLFSTITNSDYLSKKEKKRHLSLKKQYDAVYPYFLEEIKNYCSKDQDFCQSLINGTEWLSGYKDIFIDFCHVNPEGNEIIAGKIAQFIKYK